MEKLATVLTRAEVGVKAPPVRVQVHCGSGLPAVTLVGLPETAVRESKERVRSAIKSARFNWPDGRVTINLAPADLPKSGGRYDLPIALGVLAATGQIRSEPLVDHEFVGELGLDGAVTAVRGVLPVALAAAQSDRALVVPAANGSEAALVQGGCAMTTESLTQVCGYLADGLALPAAEEAPPSPQDAVPDLADVRAQFRARRALEIAAAGGHNLLFIGPPGTGKTMLATRLPGILPPLSDSEAVESAAIWSVSHQGFQSERWRRRVVRAPHHTASAVALVGGGSPPRPGEISLAHRGVLFLDELPEFPRHTLEVLREPLESGRIVISRAARQAEFPANFQLIAAMNPCPCGYLGDENGRCNCPPEIVTRYRQRVSGPLLDRIDLHVEVPPLGAAALRRASPGEPSEKARVRVVAARKRQIARAGCANAELNHADREQHCALSAADTRFLEGAADKLGLSARAFHRILKVARTIADLAGAEAVVRAHVTEAVSYRVLDRDEAV